MSIVIDGEELLEEPKCRHEVHEQEHADEQMIDHREKNIFARRSDILAIEITLERDGQPRPLPREHSYSLEIHE